MRTKNVAHLPLVVSLFLAPACDTKAEVSPEAKPEKSEKPEDAKATKPDAGASAVQKELKVTVGDKTLEGLYAFAQLDEAHGESYRLTFMDTEATCATMQRVMMKQHETLTVFTVDIKRALKADGSLTWAQGGVAFSSGGSTPASLVEVPKFEVAAGTLSGTLPAGVGHEDSEKGKLTVTGAFTAPICDPIKARKLYEWGSSKEAEDRPATDSTAKVTIAGKSYDVGGATAFPSPGNDAWNVRLTAKPHGCSMEVRDELVLTVRVGGEYVKMGLGGHLVPGGTNYHDVEGLKVEHTKTEDTITVTLSGEQDHTPSNVSYKIAVEGKVTAAVCKTE